MTDTQTNSGETVTLMTAVDVGNNDNVYREGGAKTGRGPLRDKKVSLYKDQRRQMPIDFLNSFTLRLSSKFIINSSQTCRSNSLLNTCHHSDEQ